ncbi:MAG: lipoprotein signal peptidase [Saprospiraceae bacterium]|nr:lipoprotein signal peptidase [Saprospiraceae bacterium]
MKNKFLVSLFILLTILLIDQCSKIWVKTHMEQGEEILILGQQWARIHFIENEGMAFGLKFGGEIGKLALSLFRIVAIGFLSYLLYTMIRTKENFGLIISFSLILAGAIGNMIDSAIYGLIFSHSPYHGGLAELFPDSGGYAPFLMGRVVDMFYFPMWQSKFPDWFPIWGGEDFEFFRHIFNVADSSIFCGICLFFIFYKSDHNKL